MFLWSVNAFAKTCLGDLKLCGVLHCSEGTLQGAGCYPAWWWPEQAPELRNQTSVRGPAPVLSPHGTYEILQAFQTSVYHLQSRDENDLMRWLQAFKKIMQASRFGECPHTVALAVVTIAWLWFSSSLPVGKCSFRNSLKIHDHFSPEMAHPPYSATAHRRPLVHLQPDLHLFNVFMTIPSPQAFVKCLLCTWERS